MPEPKAEKKYWIDEADKVGDRLRVKMKIVKSLLHSPLTRESILKINGLSGMSILRQSQGTNFRVTENEWEIIKGMI